MEAPREAAGAVKPQPNMSPCKIEAMLHGIDRTKNHSSISIWVSRIRNDSSKVNTHTTLKRWLCLWTTIWLCLWALVGCGPGIDAPEEYMKKLEKLDPKKQARKVVAVYQEFKAAYPELVEFPESKSTIESNKGIKGESPNSGEIESKQKETKETFEIPTLEKELTLEYTDEEAAKKGVPKKYLVHNIAKAYAAPNIATYNANFIETYVIKNPTSEVVPILLEKIAENHKEAKSLEVILQSRQADEPLPKELIKQIAQFYIRQRTKQLLNEMPDFVVNFHTKIEVSELISRFEKIVPNLDTHGGANLRKKIEIIVAAFYHRYESPQLHKEIDTSAPIHSKRTDLDSDNLAKKFTRFIGTLYRQRDTAALTSKLNPLIEDFCLELETQEMIEDAKSKIVDFMIGGKRSQKKKIRDLYTQRELQYLESKLSELYVQFSGRKNGEQSKAVDEELLKRKVKAAMKGLYVKRGREDMLADEIANSLKNFLSGVGSQKVRRYDRVAKIPKEFYRPSSIADFYTKIEAPQLRSELRKRFTLHNKAMRTFLRFAESYPSAQHLRYALRETVEFFVNEHLNLFGTGKNAGRPSSLGKDSKQTRTPSEEIQFLLHIAEFYEGVSVRQPKISAAVYQDLLDKKPKTIPEDELAYHLARARFQIEYEIAAQHAEVTEPAEDEDHIDPAQELERFIVKYPNSKRADDALYYLAQTYRDDRVKQIDVYKRLLKDYPNSEFASICRTLIRAK